MPFGDFSDRKFRRRSLNDQVSSLEKRVQRLTWREHPQDMSNVYDDIIGNSFISPLDQTIVDPSLPTFTGIASGAKGWTFSGVVYNFAGILSGALQAGFNYLGQFVAGGGAFRADQYGLYLNAYTSSIGYNAPNAFKFVDPSGGAILSYLQHTKSGGYSTLWGMANDVAATISSLIFTAISSTEAQAQWGASNGAGKEAKIHFYVAGGSSLGIITADELQITGTFPYLDDQKSAASGLATLDASSVLVEPIKRIVSGTAALTSTEGYAEWQSTTKRLLLYDSQRERSLSSIGWTSIALPAIYDPSAALTTAYSLAANGGTIVIPIIVDAHMLLQGVTVRNTDTGTARSWRWHLYEQYLNNGNAGENTLTRIESGNGNDSFTPGGAASNRTLNGTGAPTYLAPGVYWLAIQNVHATSTFGLGSTAVGSSAFAPNSAQVKTLTVPLGSTLDLVAATWTKLVDIYAVRLNGRVFGQTTAF